LSFEAVAEAGDQTCVGGLRQRERGICEAYATYASAADALKGE